MQDERKVKDAIIRGRVTWNEIYDTEEELLNDLLISDDYIQRNTKGYVYIQSFKKQYIASRKLSEKQMTQLKRNAVEVYKNVHWRTGER